MSLPYEVLRAAEREVVQQLRLAAEIGHPGERGGAREEVIRAFLRRFVPPGLGVDTGFVLDCHGNRSRQIDIVIYRTDYHPIFVVGNVAHFMIEAVVAVIENKSSITDTATLTMALENIESVKTLDRSCGGRNYIVMDFHGRGDTIDPLDAQHGVWGAVIAQQSLTTETLMNELNTFNRERPRQHWIDAYVDTERFTVMYGRVTDGGLARALDPRDAECFLLTKVGAESAERPLVDLAYLLADKLRTAATVDYAVDAYFKASTAVSVFDLPAPPSPVSPAPD